MHLLSASLMALSFATVLPLAHAQLSPSATVTASSRAEPQAPIGSPLLARKADESSPSSLLEAKDYVLAAGVVVTLFLGVWNAISAFRTSRRTTFINTVTSQRIKWIEQLRQDVATYAGLVYHWTYTSIPEGAERRDVISKVDLLNHVIRLRLNPAGPHDRRIEELLRQIPMCTDDQAKVSALLEDLTVTCQKLLKEEWDKVKRESQKGPLSDRA